MKKLSILSSVIFSLLSLVATAQTDTTAMQADSMMNNYDCYDSFFKSSTPIKNKSVIKLVLKSGKPLTLPAFMKANYMDSQQEGTQAQIGLKDLDIDGTKELVLWNFTGGAHCCDEFYFFKNTGTNAYSFAGKLLAGNTCVDRDNNFSYDFHEAFGYFFTCFACGLVMDAENEKAVNIYDLANITLNYKNGKLQIVPVTDELKKGILKNLAYIKNLGWDGGVKEGDFDDGRRKELALNLATYYFSFRKNLVETKKLFDTYYPFKDAAKIWKAFLTNLNEIKKGNDF